VVRVVTGWDKDGSPKILFTGKSPTELDDRLMHVVDIWVTDSTPPEIRGTADAAAREWRFEPPPHGSVFRVVTFLPGASSGFHSTETLDYLVIVSGEIVLTVGEEALTLRPGDVVVQNGTPHNWINRAAQPCVIAGVLLSARDKD
jgi:quercetin dioxygenase-like cupin family protein